MKKTIFTVLLLSMTISAFSAPFHSVYKEDFSVKVDIQTTNSKIITGKQNMDRNLTALELSKKMGNGINLGNTLEATRGLNTSTSRNPTDYERQWGQPVTTQEIMNAYKKAGFNSVRIPVVWTNMMKFEQKDYTIAPALLDRVEQVVNYALNAGLYVIVNDHWDNQWWGMFGSSEPAIRAEAIKLYKSMWTQIAARFKDYDERLIFEGGNEELGGRLNDVTVFSNNKRGILSEIECYDATNQINQCFVDLVRSSGGNNDARFLLIPGYDTDITKTNSSAYRMPEDKIPNRLLISVHYYTPSTYCILSEDANWGKVKKSWGTEQEISQMNRYFEQMKKFTDAGYGVIIGEYGVSKNKDGTMKDGTPLWMNSVVDICEKYNFVPMLWDCNTFFKKTGKLGFENEELAKVYLDRK